MTLNSQDTPGGGKLTESDFPPARYKACRDGGNISALHDATESAAVAARQYMAAVDRQAWPLPALPHCCGRCDQGRRLCTTPQACEQPEERPQPMTRSERLGVVVIYAVSAAVVLTLIYALAHGLPN